MLFTLQQDPETHCAEQCYFYLAGEGMVETINNWLPIVTALCGGLFFLWKVTSNLNNTLNNLNNGIARLNEHLARVDAKADKSEERLDKHETRITLLEKWKDGEL